MSVDEKVAMFQLLVSIGFKEIEVGSFRIGNGICLCTQAHRAASHPFDVTIQVLTQAREHLIRKTFGSGPGERIA